ncbi:MAG: class I SAM-dependent methyltransferase [Chloroflexi bacterium]|nr:class I SAM-dependent methyltransferase [Chloroflexota bacterium]
MHLHHLFETWDAKAKRFHSEFGGNLEGASIVEPYLKAREVHRLLDVGCGHGRYVPVYEAAGVIEIVGVDVSKWNVEMAEKRFPHLVFRCLNISDLDYEPDYFDAGVSANCLSYVPPRQIARTLERLSTQCRSLLLIEQTRGRTTLGRHVHDYSGLSERMQKTEHYRYNELHDVMVWDRTDALQQ